MFSPPNFKTVPTPMEGGKGEREGGKGGREGREGREKGGEGEGGL